MNREVNKEGLTFEEWVNAAGGRQAFELPILKIITSDIAYGMRRAWRNCEDPTEYRNIRKN